MAEGSGPAQFPPDLSAQFGSLGSFYRTSNVPLSFVDKDDSHPFDDRMEVMEKTMKRMRAQHDKQMKKIRV